MSESQLSDSTRHLFKGEYIKYMKRVPQVRGDVITNSSCPFSPTTAMMRNSKLSKTQQRLLDNLVQEGYSLPSTPLPGMTGRISRTESTPPASIVYARRPPRKLPTIPNELFRPSLRTLPLIQQSDAYKPDTYRPQPQKNREEEKKKLICYMQSNGASTKPSEADDDGYGYDEEFEEDGGFVGSKGAHGKIMETRKGRKGRKRAGAKVESGEGDEFTMCK
jgi:hypothetical protein